ncbi:MAG: type II/IV secretion system ATPase subunit [Chloroflexi bacterium]|nr:type II/IV secretion system ATPase subunit [Chloroflexota bacterium]
MPDRDGENGHANPDPQHPELSPLVPGRGQRPSFSLEALRERIETQFNEETANRADILLELDTENKRRDALREVMDYVLAVEAVTLSPVAKQTLLERAYRNLFSFGPLDRYLRDEAITEIAINGPAQIHVRRGMDKPMPTGAAFDDHVHLASVLQRVLATSGVILSESEPFLETGVVINGRAARISLIGPPVNPDYNLEIRLHPTEPITFEDLHTRFRAVPPQVTELLQAILQAEHGLLIVGEVGLGKTTLASALAHFLPVDATIFAVERAAELHLPAYITRRAAIPPTPSSDGTSFQQQFQAALEQMPDWLIVDEIRGDEAAAAWSALEREETPRYVWLFRGSSVPKRLHSALSMVVRKHQQSIDQTVINHALARHLPFVAAFKTINGQPRLHLVAEWVLGEPDAEGYTSLTLRPLISEQPGGWLVTENQPTRPLPLPDDFWE